MDSTWLDALVDATTAFGSLEAMEASLAEGYVPTIYPRSRRARLLRKVLVALGWIVYPA